MTARRAVPAAPEPDSARAPSAPVRLVFVLLLAGLVARIAWAWIYGPVSEGDSVTYVQFAERLLSGRLAEDDGGRTPVYPLFLVPLGMRPSWVQVAQGVLGLGTSGLVFALAWRAGGGAALALLVGLAHALALDTLAFEAFVATESVATFLVTAAALLLVEARRRPDAARLAALSLVLALAGLTKPFLLYLVPFAAAALLLAPDRAVRRAALRPAAVAAFLLPVLLLVGAWCAWEWRAYGMLGPSTFQGYRLSQHVGGVMEIAPDRYATIRDIYLEHRREQVARSGSHVGTIWAAIPDMRRATGLSYVALSKQVHAMSVDVARARPDVLARSIGEGWLRFWSRPMYLKGTGLHRPGDLAALQLLGRGIRALGWLVHGAFLALALALALRRGIRPAARLELPLIVALVLAGSVVAAVGELSDNGRYAAPFLPLVQYAVAAAAFALRPPAARPGGAAAGGAGRAAPAALRAPST